MQVDITVYDANGVFLRSVSCPQSMVAAQEIPEGGGYMEGSYDGRFYYVSGGVPTDRPVQDTTVNGTAIESLPIPCMVIIAGGSYEVPDGTLELTFEVPGSYPFTVKAFPYLDFKGVINAT